MAGRSIRIFRHSRECSWTKAHRSWTKGHRSRKIDLDKLLQANEKYAPQAPEGEIGVAVYPNWVVAYAGVQSSPTKERREDG